MYDANVTDYQAALAQVEADARRQAKRNAQTVSGAGGRGEPVDATKAAWQAIMEADDGGKWRGTG